MKITKKILLFFALSVSLASVSRAVQAPLDAQGHALATIDWFGALPCSIDASTGTNAVICGSTNVPNLVYGVIASSIPATDFIVLRDSVIANTASSTMTIVFANGSGVNASGNATTVMFKFPVPLKFVNGISMNDATSPNGIGRWTLLYRPMRNQTTSE